MQKVLEPNRWARAPVERFEWAIVVGATVVAAVLSGWGIASKSLWYDEGFTVSTALRPWGSLVRLSVETETNGFVHAFAVRAFSEIGTSEGVLRALSALCFVATVPMVWLVARRLVNRRAAILSVLLVATHGSLVAFGQNIRAYAMAVLLANVVSWFFLLDVEEPRRWKVAGWAGTGLLLAGVSLQAFLLLPAHLAASCLLEPGRRHLRRRLSWGALSALLGAPIAIASSEENGDPSVLTGFDAARDVVKVLTGDAGWLGAVAYALMSVAVLSMVATDRRRHRGPSWGVWFALSWLVVPALGLLVLSAVAPTFFGRYLLFTVPAIAILAGAGIDHAVSSWRAPVLWRLAAGAVVVFGAIRGPVDWLVKNDMEDWRSAANLLFQDGEPDDAVLFAKDTTRLFFEYYRHQAGDLMPPQSFWPAGGWGQYETGDQLYQAPPPAAARAAAQAASRVWLVEGSERQGREQELATAREVLMLTHRLAEVVMIGDVAVERYERR